MQSIHLEHLACAVERRAAADLADHRILGASVLLAQSGKLRYRRHFGFVSPEGNAPVDDRTLYRLASMTKPVTAAVTMRLCQRGKLSLDDPITRYYPAFSNLQVADGEGRLSPVGTTITLRHLLTHTSGIGSGTVWGESVARMTTSDRESVESFVAFLSSCPLSFPPGTRQEYSGVGAFSVLSGILQKVAGKTLEELFSEELLCPLGMEDTTFLPTKEQWARLITMHDRKDGRSVAAFTPEGCVFENFPARNFLGGAGLISSPTDYLRFGEFLRTGRTPEGEVLLQGEALDAIRTPQLSETLHPGQQRWGLAVRVIVSEDYRRLPVGTYGWSGAYGTHFWVDPQNEIVAVYMKNSHYDGGSGAKTSANFEEDVASALL